MMTMKKLAQPFADTDDEVADLLIPVRTTAQLVDVDDEINTVDKRLGRMAWDSTLNLPVWATGATAAAAWSVLNPALATEASAGITGFAESFGAGVVRAGSLIKTTILIDITGLEGGDAGDIIGDATPSISHLGQLTAAVNGVLVYGTITCLETPGGGDIDVDLYAAVEATGVQDTLISVLDETQLLNNGDWTGAVATPILMTALPADGEYLYLVDPIGDTNEFTAGRFLIEFYGV